MTMIDFKGRVALITGAGGGLGRSHALYLAQRGAKIVVNDVGASVQGEGAQASMADETVELIRGAGGEAVADYSSVEDCEGAKKMVACALDHFGRLDILINNAGILRDTSFKKQDEEAWQRVLDVHLTGTRHVTKAAWDHFLERQYGRIVMTTSASGLYGNFGQSNYAAAKMGVIGLMNALKEEGARYNIKINAIAPMARSRMTEAILPPSFLEALNPRLVSPLVAYLASESCEPSGHCYAVGAGRVARVALVETEGYRFDAGQGFEAEDVANHLNAIENFSRFKTPENLMAATAILLEGSEG